MNCEAPGYSIDVEAIKGLIGRFDRYQQGHTPLAVVWAVNKKYGDDKGGYLAALIAYYAFISLFPLMLAAFSIAAWVLPGHDALLNGLLKHFANFPLLGGKDGAIQQVQSRQLSGSVLAVVVGLLGLLWGATGLAKTLQHTMDEVWNVPGRDRAGFLPQLLIVAKWSVAFAVGIAASTYITSLSSIFDWGPVGPELAALPAMLVNVGVFLLSFRIFTDKGVSARTLLPGAVVGGVAWTVLTGFGISLLTHQVKHSGALYGTFGATLGFIGFLYLVARLSTYGAELNVVLDRHLFPRTVLAPPLTGADKRQLTQLAKREERVDEETVHVEI